MLALARVDSSDVIYDLGCGDGRIVIAAARDHGARGVCVEVNPALIRTSQKNADTAGVRSRIEFRQIDLFKTDLSNATVVALYLSPALNQRLRPKLFRELQPSARIVSHNFDMGDWKPDTVVRVEWPTGTTSSVYSWVLPADVAGNWELTISGGGVGRRYRVRFTQHYQEISGTASSEGGPVSLSLARLRGDSLEFGLNDLRLSGLVSPNSMVGLAHGNEPGATSWRAVRR